MAASPCHPEALDIGRHSNCPSDNWHDRAAPLLASGSGGELVMINVGANKGYNLAEWMQRYSAADVSNKQWHQLMMRRAEPACALQCCGVCLVCHRKRMQQLASPAALRLHAFELQPSNERLLRQLVRLTNAPVEVHAQAVSNATGVVFTRDSGAPGYESVSAMRSPRGAKALARNVTTVDAFLAARRIPRVGLVSIDTEGWDAFVMRGMEGALRARTIDAVEFEYTRAWKPHLGERALAEHLTWLDGVGYTCFWQVGPRHPPWDPTTLHGTPHDRYVRCTRCTTIVGDTCFWQGNRGALAQANGGCWRDAYHARISHRWSNLVCTARPDLIALFRETSKNTA